LSEISYLEALGEAQVRRLISNGGLPDTLRPAAIKWLADIDHDSERLKEASQAEQIDIARSAKDAAWAAARAADRAATAAEKANARATIALIIAIISVISTVVGIWLTYQDEGKHIRFIFPGGHASSADSSSGSLSPYAY
jgi:hypothetical protein